MDSISGDGFPLSMLFDEVPVVSPEFFTCPRYLNSAQTHHGVSSGVILNQANGNTDNLSHSQSVSNSPVLREPLLANEKRERKRRSDRDYRRREKNKKVQMGLDLKKLEEENDSLKIMNKSLQEENESMKQALTNQQNKIRQLQSDLSLVKQICDKQAAQVKSLTLNNGGPLEIEIEKLKAEIASLRKNASQYLEENKRLTNEKKVLEVQNDALCVKIVSLNEKMQGQEP